MCSEDERCEVDAPCSDCVENEAWYGREVLPDAYGPARPSTTRREVIETFVDAHQDALDDLVWVIPYASYVDAKTKEHIGGYSPINEEPPPELSHLLVVKRRFVSSY